MDTLKNILDSHLNNRIIDFLSVDVEGYEIEVLKSNDWNKYRPLCIMVEINNHTEQIISYINDIGYILVYINHTNGIFVDNMAQNGIT